MTDHTILEEEDVKYSVTRNACKMCTPLGACLAFKGIENTMPFLHGSQGCATYIRRYMISHFREPIDIASSSFTEHNAVFGGKTNLHKGLANVISQYKPSLVGVMTTCLSETIGDNIPMILKEFKDTYGGKLPELVEVSTPSYTGTHREGFHKAIYAIIDQMAEAGETGNHVTISPSMVSPADLRLIKEITADMEIECILLPDYSETLDGTLWSEYNRIPKGGTSISDLKKVGRSKAFIDLKGVDIEKLSKTSLVKNKFGMDSYTFNLPIGVEGTDKFLDVLCKLSNHNIPQKYVKERGRLIDSYADGHKYVSGKKVAIFTDEDFLPALASFVTEIGMIPALIATGAKSTNLKKYLKTVLSEEVIEQALILENADHIKVHEEIENIKPDILLSSSKGFSISRKLNLPLVRVGFPIHDRFGAQRLEHLFYRGTQSLFDQIVNELIRHTQSKNEWGFTYV